MIIFMLISMLKSGEDYSDFLTDAIIGKYSESEHLSPVQTGSSSHLGKIINI